MACLRYIMKNSLKRMEDRVYNSEHVKLTCTCTCKKVLVKNYKTQLTLNAQWQVGRLWCLAEGFRV